jgi:hypothetical protein
MIDQEQMIVIKPNSPTIIPLEESYHSLLKSSEEDEESEYICRAFIQDETEHGIVLPVIIEDNNLCFVLPEQLCIFNPNKNYILKIELVLETQLLIPVITTCSIDLNDLIEAEEEQDEQEDKSELNEPIKADKDEIIDDDIEAAIAAVAPLPIVEQKRIKVDEIAKNFDSEFVKQVLFTPPSPPVVQMQKAQELLRAHEPVKLNDEQLALKVRMKSLLKTMLD